VLTAFTRHLIIVQQHALATITQNNAHL